ncbi:MAG TPA: FkbM family methyltransferase [Candidatus Paceibacterota bacterium]|nr:FkbM family methyltransferase [Candidatus Paceibacterota bacterium]
MNIALQFKALYYPLRRLLGPVVVTDDFGIKVKWYPHDKIPIKKLITRENYKYEFSQYDKYAKGVVVDVGANIGIHAVYLSRLATKVHAFEPVGSTFSYLLETVALNGAQEKIETHRLGLGESAGELEMQIFSLEHSSWNSAYVPKNQQISPVGVERVPVTTLDDFAEDKQLQKIDFVKIDVEGHELQVLRGAKKLLGEKRISTLSFEVTQMHAHDPQEIFHLLRDCGYEVEDYDPARPHHNYYARLPSLSAA